MRYAQLIVRLEILRLKALYADLLQAARILGFTGYMSTCKGLSVLDLHKRILFLRLFVGRKS